MCELVVEDDVKADVTLELTFSCELEVGKLALVFVACAAALTVLLAVLPVVAGVPATVRPGWLCGLAWLLGRGILGAKADVADFLPLVVVLVWRLETLSLECFLCSSCSGWYISRTPGTETAAVWVSPTDILMGAALVAAAKRSVTKREMLRYCMMNEGRSRLFRVAE